MVKTDRRYGSHYTYNRKQKKVFLIKEGEPFIMYLCFGIVDNALLSICKPDFVHRVVDRKLMPSEEIRKMEALKEDDNPCLVLYELK